MYKTPTLNSQNIKHKWHFIDAENIVLGKLATKVAKVLMGKNKPHYTTNQNFGDKVVITNAEKIAVTGTKMKNKMYYHHTDYPGGFRSETLEKLKARKPTEVISKAVMGMLPKNRLRDVRMSNLYIYEGPTHPHKAWEPKVKKEDSEKGK